MTFRNLMMPVLAVFALVSCQSTETPKAMSTQLDSIAYAVGMDIGAYYHERQGIELDPEFVYQGFRDVVSSDSATVISREQGVALISDFARMMEARHAAENEINGQRFLEQNLRNPDVQSLPGGVQYQVIAEGTGASPRADNIVKIRFEGKLLDETLFASSNAEPDRSLEIDIAQAVPGIQTALTHMKPGDQWRIWVPAEQGYGSDSRPPITPNSLLIYDMELLEIVR